MSRLSCGRCGATRKTPDASSHRPSPRTLGDPAIARSPSSLSSIRWIGCGTAFLAIAVDQASKLWLLHIFDIAARQPVALAPWLDLILAWNRGISYSLLTAETDAGRWLLIAGTVAATALLGVWLARARTRLTGLALGLLIGGALGNVVDRVLYGAVLDFVYFHVGSFRWYVFNGADCAIVVGVALLLLDLLRPSSVEAAKLP